MKLIKRITKNILCRLYTIFCCVSLMGLPMEMEASGLRETRTPGFYIASVAFSQLNYEPKDDDACVVLCHALRCHGRVLS